MTDLHRELYRIWMRYGPTVRRALHGVQSSVSFPLCRGCDGTGESSEPCAACEGRCVDPASWLAFKEVAQGDDEWLAVDEHNECRPCGGSGRAVCLDCKGSGLKGIPDASLRSELVHSREAVNEISERYPDIGPAVAMLWERYRNCAASARDFAAEARDALTGEGPWDRGQLLLAMNRQLVAAFWAAEQRRTREALVALMPGANPAEIRAVVLESTICLRCRERLGTEGVERQGCKHG